VTDRQPLASGHELACGPPKARPVEIGAVRTACTSRFASAAAGKSAPGGLNEFPDCAPGVRHVLLVRPPYRKGGARRAETGIGNDPHRAGAKHHDACGECVPSSRPTRRGRRRDRDARLPGGAVIQRSPCDHGASFPVRRTAILVVAVLLGGLLTACSARPDLEGPIRVEKPERPDRIERPVRRN